MQSRAMKLSKQFQLAYDVHMYRMIPRNYGVTCEDEAKRRNLGTKTKTFEENGYLLLYAVSNKEDMEYQRQLITRIRDNAFNGMDGGDITDHITKVLEFTEWIKMPNVKKIYYDYTSSQICSWWRCLEMENDELNGTTIDLE
ncbi:hypothetical protein Tco_1275735 [Tanacetum coccineum]